VAVWSCGAAVGVEREPGDATEGREGEGMNEHEVEALVALRNALEAALETVSFIPVRHNIDGSHQSAVDVAAVMPMDVFNSLAALFNEAKATS
jgi:hypothetical protein